MLKNNYSNFVRPSSPQQSTDIRKTSVRIISGEDARKIYLEEVRDARLFDRPCTSQLNYSLKERKVIRAEEKVPLTNKDLFLIVQNNDVDRLKCVLDEYPEKKDIVDGYGWSLLMIACQANSINSAKELLHRGIDTSVRDKAGNSARSLVIKNKNYELAGVLLKYRECEEQRLAPERTKNKLTEEYNCNVCNKTFPDKEEHLSSTLHNISASRGKKIPANYVIPATNRGYQLMLKGGWDRDSGLGKDGSGKQYPIKTIQKKDRKGLGHEKKKKETAPEDNVRHKARRMFADDHKRNRRFEINFRREFY